MMSLWRLVVPPCSAVHVELRLQSAWRPYCPTTVRLRTTWTQNKGVPAKAKDAETASNYPLPHGSLRLQLPPPQRSASAVDDVYTGIVKGFMPRIRHRSEKARVRAIESIRRRIAEQDAEFANDAAKADRAEGANPVPVQRVLSLVKPEWRRLCIGLAAVSVSSMAMLAFPTAVGRVVDAMALGQKDVLASLTLGMMSIVAVGSAAVYVRTSQLVIVSETVARTLRKRVMHCMLYQPMQFYDENDTGRLINRLSTDTAIVSSTITDNVSRFLKSLMGMTTSCVFLYNISPILTGWAISVIPVYAIAALGYGEYRKQLVQGLLARLARENQVAMERLTAIRTVHSYVCEDHEYDRYCDAVDASFRLAKKVGVAEGIFLAGGFLVSQGTLLAVLYYGGHLLWDGALTIGQLTSFSMYTGYLYISVGQMGVAVSEFMKAQGASRRVFTVIDTGTDNQYQDGKMLESFHEKVEFRNVHFAYPTRPDVEVLKGLTLTLEPGETLAVAGLSGSGKSTLGLLLARYYEPASGQILIDGHDINTLDTRWLRTQIAEVMQDPVLLSGTIAECIAYGKADASPEEIVDAATAANAHEFIMQLPEGYNTQVGERGKKLSGGQRQRIAIARALIKDARIYVLDEMTSALDSDSERLLINAFQKVMEKKTAIVFSHHFHVLRNADKVAVLKNGVVSQYGTPDELIAQPGLLRRMAEDLET